METPNDIRVESWEELSQRLFENTWNESLRRFRSPYVFRGVGDIAFALDTSLRRLGGPYEKLEPVILRTFRKYAHRDASPGETFWHWLILAQHHGLPTRLLDWTFSPHVAMHFATSDFAKYHADAAIWSIDTVQLRDQLPEQLRQILEEEYAIGFSVDMLNQVAESFQEFDKLADEPFVVFIDPPSLDERIVNQSASFSVMSNPGARLSDWLLDKPNLYRRIIIPAELKWEIRDKLDQMNFTERILFPGLDGLCSWLKRYYSPRE